MSGLTVKQTPLLSATPGRYATTTPTLKGGAGELKPMVGPRSMATHHSAVTPFSGGKKGKSVELRGAGTIIPTTADVEW